MHRKKTLESNILSQVKSARDLKVGDPNCLMCASDDRCPLHAGKNVNDFQDAAVAVH